MTDDDGEQGAESRLVGHNTGESEENTVRGIHGHPACMDGLTEIFCLRSPTVAFSLRPVTMLLWPVRNLMLRSMLTS